MHNKIIRWIHEDIDGIIRPEDKRQLEPVLRDDPEAKALWTSLKSMARKLEEVPEFEPPKTLKKRVMNAVESAIPAKVVRLSGPKSRVRTGLRFAYVFVLGSAVTLLLIAVFSGDRAHVLIPASGEHVGAIGLNHYKSFPIINKIVVDEAGITGTIFVREMNKISGLEVYLKAGEPFDITVSYPSDEVGFDMYKPLGLTMVTLEAGDGFVRISGGQDDAYLLLFGSKQFKAASLEFKVKRQESTLLSRSIPLWHKTVNASEK